MWRLDIHGVAPTFAVPFNVREYIDLTGSENQFPPGPHTAISIDGLEPPCRLVFPEIRDCRIVELDRLVPGKNIRSGFGT